MPVCNIGRPLGCLHHLIFAPSAIRYNDSAMPLSDQDKQRIREEETFRSQVRDELSRQGPDNRLKFVLFWVVLIAVTVLLFAVVRSGTPK